MFDERANTPLGFTPGGPGQALPRHNRDQRYYRHGQHWLVTDSMGFRVLRHEASGWDFVLPKGYASNRDMDAAWDILRSKDWDAPAMVVAA